MIRDPEVALALAYASAAVRDRLRALWAFDQQLADILRTTREPMVGQMRLTWWHDAVADPAATPGEPILAALAGAGFAAAGLQRIVAGWEALLDGDAQPALRAYAAGRGGGLFDLAGGLLGAWEVGAAGAGWALVDLARHHSRADVGQRALALAAELLDHAPRTWRRGTRPLGMLTKLARRDLGGVETQGAPRRIAAMAGLALTGR